MHPLRSFFFGNKTFPSVVGILFSNEPSFIPGKFDFIFIGCVCVCLSVWKVTYIIASLIRIDG